MDIPDDLSNTDIKLNANQAYGGYQNIALVDIYNGKFTTEQIVQDPIQVISKEDSFVGCYADTDGNGSIDGIIYADLLVGKPDSGSWSGCEWYYSAVTYTLPTDVIESNVKDYIISDTAVTDSRFDSTPRDVISLSDKSEGTKARFYVLNLEDVTDATTAKVGNLTGHIPSKEEWAMFGDAFGLTVESGNYYGLSVGDAGRWYMTSDEDWTFSALYAAVLYEEAEGNNQRVTVTF